MGYTTSGAEQVASWAAGARVVKIFNTTGHAKMANPAHREGRPMMLYCGDDAQGKKVAAQLAAERGFEPYDVGPLTEARRREPFALVWIHLALQQKMGTGFAFRLIYGSAKRLTSYAQSSRVPDPSADNRRRERCEKQRATNRDL